MNLFYNLITANRRARKMPLKRES